MSAHTGPNLQTAELARFIPARVEEPIELTLGLEPGKSYAKESAIAGAFLLGYLVLYLTIGFAAVGAFGWAWAAVFR
jgi:hypothetical protein